MHDGDTCVLGALNLSNFVDACQMDTSRLRYATTIATRALDNVIDIISTGVERVEQASKNNRRIGLGVFGLAEMLFALRLGYGTQEGRDAAALAMRTINDEAGSESRRLAAEKGAFLNLALSIYLDAPRRNACLTTIAPTGSTAMLADTVERGPVTGGCEPLFALAYTKKNIMGGASLRYINAQFERDLRAEMASAGASSDAVERVLCEVARSGSLSSVPVDWGVPAWMRDVYVTSGDLTPEQHVLMQAALQRHVENSISKTVNMPREASVADVEQIYMLAYRNKLKGVTIYRTGSREKEVLETTATGAERDARAAECTCTCACARCVPRPPATKSRMPTACPDCSADLRASEGCMTCDTCAFSACNR